MITEQQYNEAIIVIEKYKNQLLQKVEIINSYTIANKNQEKNLYDELNVRAANVLFNQKFGLNKYDAKVKDLQNISLSELYKTKDCGAKTIDEIQFLCHNANIELMP